MMMFELEMDSREPFEMKGFLEEIGFTVHIKNNKTIDYTYEDKIAFSRKTTEDFINTLYSRDRDLFAEMEKLADYPYRYLMISGNWQPILDASINALHTMHHIVGAITSLEVKHGLRVLSWLDDEMLAYGIYKVCEKTEEMFGVSNS